MELSFDEIKNAQHFEELIGTYFENLKKQFIGGIKDIVVNPTGMGPDEGVDLLVTFQVTDSIASFERRWIIQAKFYDSPVSPNTIKDINLPTLLYSFKANGYLLICKKYATSKLTKLFSRLEEECIYGNNYKVWSGEQFKRLILNDYDIQKQYFPLYYGYINDQEK